MLRHVALLALSFVFPGALHLLPAATPTSVPSSRPYWRGLQQQPLPSAHHPARLPLPEPLAAPAGGLSKEAIKELLKDYCDDAVRTFVEDKLKPRYQVWPLCPLACPRGVRQGLHRGSKGG